MRGDYWTERIGWRESVRTLCGWLNDLLPIVLFVVVIVCWMRGMR